MKIKKKKICSGVVLIIIVFFFSIIFLPIDQAFQRDVYITLQFIFIGTIAVIGILESSKKNPFSLGMIVHFFFFVFIFCGGITQFAKNNFKWGLEASLNDVNIANYIIIIFQILFFGARKLKLVFRVSNRERKKSFWSEERRISNFSMMPVIILLIFCGIYTIVTVGWRVLLIREIFSASGIWEKLSSSSIKLLIMTLIRGLATWIMMIATLNMKRKKNIVNIIFVLIVYLVGIINIPPTGVARYVTGAVYGGLFIYYFDFLKKGRRLLYFLSVGLLIVFPLMNAFRGNYTDTITLDYIQEALGNVSNNFTRADYDAYSMIIFSIQYVEKMGISLGKQLLGVFLFFIPSSLWKTKPGGSGATIIECMDTGYNPNVSCPIIAEGYINFGIVGVIIFAVLLGYITRRIDSHYWKEWRNKNCIGEILYCFSVPFTLFICRGDLLSTFSYFIGYFISLIVVINLSNLFRFNFSKR